MHKGKVLNKGKNYTVINCTNCGYAHINPLPGQKEIEEYYEKKFYQNSKTSYFDDYERDHDWWELNYKELINKMEELHGASPKTKKRKKMLLDIGSGPGLFLNVASKLGIEALGIEPSEKAFKYSKNKYKCDVLNTTLEEVKGHRKKFDFIHSSLVLEHVLDPYVFIEKSMAMMADNGLFCIIVPNDFNTIQEINLKLGRQQWWVSPFEHLNYFNPKSLRKLFEKAGLKVVYENVTFPIDLFLLMDQNYLVDSDIGKACHSMRKNFEFNIEKSQSLKFKENLYKAFSKLGVGRELVIIGKKIR